MKVGITFSIFDLLHAGHRGMVGSAVCGALESKGFSNIIRKTSAELNMRSQQAVLDFYNQEKSEVVIDAAAKVGGIFANDILTLLPSIK
jgi:GDP-L-fucose synthase